MSQAQLAVYSEDKVDDGKGDCHILTAQNAGDINIFYLPSVIAIARGVQYGLVPLK
jgi:hypothetical protein